MGAIQVVEVADELARSLAAESNGSSMWLRTKSFRLPDRFHRHGLMEEIHSLLESMPSRRRKS